MNLNELALVVLNYNSYAMTIKCVDQLLSFSAGFHIVIVDNMSTDESYNKLVEYYDTFNVDVIETNYNGGYSAGNNVGIHFAEKKYSVKYVAIVNPDVIIPSLNVIKELVVTLENDDRCAITGGSPIDREGVINPEHAAWKIPSMYEFIISKSIFYRKKNKTKTTNTCRNIQVDCVAGCFFIIKIEALRAINYMDEDLFMYDEEILLGFKLKNKGYTEILRTDLLYYHNHIPANSPTIKNYIGKRKIRFRSDVVLFKKVYSSKWGLLFLLFNEYLNRFVLFFWFLFKWIRQGGKQK